MAEELKPCPFCGGTETFVERLDYSAAYVQCDSRIDEHSACFARGPVGVQDDDGEEIPGAAAAIRAWNAQAAARATPPSPSTAEDERSAFEAWISRAMPDLLPLARNSGDYQRVGTQMAWTAWQARAALSANAADREVEAEKKLEKFISWYLREGKRSEIHAYGHIERTTREHILAWLETDKEKK